ncbi:hypothetical protein NDU88_005579 [Pleurodeles waltl]|uniref:Uncharacterized protein n=1 Tax=Pleurodeles waltl TaxID=8319 RepID=A0AAV7L329_PLEWA|nr:hypothetical protein NDU88_005579 [Pleurodeles waltl]
MSKVRGDAERMSKARGAIERMSKVRARHGTRALGATRFSSSMGGVKLGSCRTSDLGSALQAAEGADVRQTLTSKPSLCGAVGGEAARPDDAV